jgi:hypothetical protein
MVRRRMVRRAVRMESSFESEMKAHLPSRNLRTMRKRPRAAAVRKTMTKRGTILAVRETEVRKV